MTVFCDTTDKFCAQWGQYLQTANIPTEDDTYTAAT